MKTYRVYFSYEAQAYVDVVAESESKAKNMVIFGEYDECTVYDGTQNEIERVEEIKEEKNDNI